MRVYKKLLSLSILSVIVMSSCTVTSTINTSKYTRMDFGTQNGKPISWYVVGDDDNNHLVLMSEKVLDVKAYDTKEKVSSYMKSTLYDYLNTDFVNSTFSSEEREKIVFVNDKDNCMVTLPSLENLLDLYGDMNYVKDGYYNDKDYFEANKDIIAKPTQVAIDNDIDVFDNKVFAEILQTTVDKRYEFANGSVPYWILDIDEETGYSLNVTSTGYVALNDANTGYIGIRPIIRIKE